MTDRSLENGRSFYLLYHNNGSGADISLKSFGDKKERGFTIK
jgi:hypothetical protein